MADPSLPTAPPADGPARAPALPSTADTVPYVPISWMAVAAMAVSVLFLLILLVAGGDAVWQRRPLLMPELLILPAIAVVLSFAARRIIRNAEGTRTGDLFGIDLPNAAWWIAVVCGLGFAAYLLAIEYAVRRDAQAEVERWVETLKKVDAAPTAEDQNLAKAFYRTRDPNERANIPPTDSQQLEGRWGNDFIAFRQSDLVRLLLRNPGKCEISLGGLRDWSQKASGVECTYNLTLTCPEGTFPIHVPLKGVETGSGSGAAGGRQWQIVLNTNAGYINRDTTRLTPYGWFVRQLERQGAEEGRRFIDLCADRRMRPYAYLDFTRNPAGTELVHLTPEGFAARAAAIGATAAMIWHPSQEIYTATASRLFTLLGGVRPDDNQMQTFQNAWNTVGFTPAGSRLQGNPDINSVVVFTDKSIEVHVPLEIPLPATKGAITAARGRMVFECTTPGAVEEAKRLRESANPGQGSTIPPDDIRRKTFTWKLVRIESDLKRVQVDAGPGAPGGPMEGP
jgi:hypothetical protein